MKTNALRLACTSWACLLVLGLCAPAWSAGVIPPPPGAVINVPGTHPTIQDAVNNASSGDEIVLAVTSYFESVDLGLMGSAIGGGPGDLEIRGDGGLAEIHGGEFAALSNGTSFAGALVLQDLLLSSTNDGGVVLHDLEGQLTVTGCTITGTVGDAIGIRQGPGTELCLTIVDNTFIGLQDDGVFLEIGDGAFLRGRITGNQFLNAIASGDAVDVTVHSPGGTGSGLLCIDGNTMDDLMGKGVRLDVNDGGRLEASVAGNTILNTRDEGVFITHQTGSGAIINADIDNNVIANTGDNGITLWPQGTNEMNVLVRSNLIDSALSPTIFGTEGAVTVFANDPAPVANFHIVSNEVVNPNQFAYAIDNAQGAAITLEGSGDPATLIDTTNAGGVGGTLVFINGPVATAPDALVDALLPDCPADGACAIPYPREGSIHGFAFEDVDGDGAYNSAIDLPFEGVEITVSGIDESAAVIDVTVLTDSNGEFWVTNLLPSIIGAAPGGGYTVAQVPPSGYAATTPSSLTTNLYVLNELVAFPGQAMLPPGDPRLEVLVGAPLQFGSARLDFGDAPFLSLLGDDGARHLLGSQIFLGALVDAESDGQPDATATGDDLNAADDEDGVVFTGPILQGGTATLDVTTSVGQGVLNAWVDFDGDGAWGVGEQVFVDTFLPAGVNNLTFAVPPGAIPGLTFARFRVDSSGGLQPTGPAADGEVEDYQVEILPTVDLSVAKEGLGIAQAGLPYTFLLTVSNAGPSAAANVMLTDIPAPPLVPLGPTNWLLGTLAAGASTTVTFEVEVPADAVFPECGWFNQARVTNDVTDLVPGNNAASTGGPVEIQHDLSITKVCPDTVAAGSTFTCELVVSNAGPAAAGAFLVTDTFQPDNGVVFRSADCPVSAFTSDFVSISWFIGGLPPGGTTNCVLTFESTDCCIGGTVSNMAGLTLDVNGQFTCPRTDPNPSNDTAAAGFLVLADSEPPMFACPSNLVFATRAEALAFQPDSNAIEVTDNCTTNTLLLIESNVLVDTTCSGVVRWVYNAFDVCPSDGGEQANNRSSCTQLVTWVDTTSFDCIPRVDLSIVKTGMGLASPGLPYSWNLLVSNAGPDTATNVVVDDVLDPAVFDPGGSVQFVLGGLPAGASTSLVVTADVRVDAPLPNCLVTNVATVTNDVFDVDASNNRSSAEAPVEVLYDLVVTKEGPALVDAGTTFDVTVVVSNAGPGLSASSLLGDELPPGLIVVTNDCGATGSGTFFTWDVPALAPGAVSMCTFTFETGCCLDLVATNRAFLMDLPKQKSKIYLIDKSCQSRDINFSNDAAVRVTTVAPDVEPPMLLGVPPDVFVECGETVPPAATVTATDTCSRATIQFTSTTNFPCQTPDVYVITNTWTALDSCENSTTAVQVVEVRDTLPPMIDCPPDLAVQCEADLPPPGTATAVDACSPEIAAALIDTRRVTDTASCVVVVQYVFAAMDLCGNMATCTQSVTIADTMPPEILPVDDLMLECGTAGLPLLVFQATDNCDGEVPVEVFSEATGSCPIVRTFTLRAEDLCGNVTSTSFRIVTDDTFPPTLQCPPGDSVSCLSDIPPPGPVEVFDFCSTNPVVTVTTNDRMDGCTYTVAYIHTATDDCGNIASCTQTWVAVDVVAPVLECPTGGSVVCAADIPAAVLPSAINNCGTAVVDVVTNTTGESCDLRIDYVFTASDPCGNNIVCTQSWTAVDTEPPIIICPPSDLNATSLPPPNPTLVSATDNCGSVTVVVLSSNASSTACGERIDYVYGAMDDCGNMAVCTQSFARGTASVPSIVCPEGGVLDCGDDLPVPGVPQVSDPCGTPTVTVMTNLTPLECGERIEFVFTAMNEFGNSDICTQRFDRVDTTPPTCSVSDIAVECLSEVPGPDVGSVTASDDCDTPVVRVLSADTPSGCEGSVEYIYEVSDACGNTATCTQTVTWADITPPVISCPPDLRDVSTATPPDLAGIVATDNCGSAVVRLLNTTLESSGCEETIEYVLVATDDCGNRVQCTQTVVVVSPSTPIVSCPSGVVVECFTEVPPPAMPSLADACDTPVLTIATNVTGTACEGTVSYTYSAVNRFGNTDSCTQTHTFGDTQAPMIDCPINPIRLQGGLACMAAVPDLGVRIADNCDEAPAISYAPALGTMLSGPGPHTVTVTATDSCGNVSTCSVSVVLDCLVAIGDRVWEDLDANGLQDEGEPGVPGVTVRLQSCDLELDSRGDKGNGFTAVTGSDGSYQILAPPGDYQVLFEVPAGYVPTLADVGNDETLDSDADTNTLLSTRCTGSLGAGDMDADLDLGIYRPVTLEGVVWNDIDTDGDPAKEDLMTLGIGGAIVNIFKVGSGGQLTFVRSVMSSTDLNTLGSWSTDLPPGTYQVDIDVDSLPEMLELETTDLSYIWTVGSGESRQDNYFGFVGLPTAVELISAGADETGVAWETAWEQDVLGFEVVRYDARGRSIVNTALVLARGGDRYEVRDPSRPAGPVLYEIVELSTSLERSVVARFGLTPPIGQPTATVEAGPAGVSFHTDGTTASWLVTGLAADAVVEDVTDASAPISLTVEFLETESGRAAYFSWFADRHIRVR